MRLGLGFRLHTAPSATLTPHAPNIPVVGSASGIQAEQFTANWAASAIDASHDAASSYLLDVSSNSGFTALLAGYNNLNVGNVTSLDVLGLAHNTAYWYRVRAANGVGTTLSSGTSGPWTTLVAAPNAPSLSAASGVSSSAFTANWAAPSTDAHHDAASSYRLDVATLDFADPGFDGSQYVTGYNNLNVAGTTQAVSGLTHGTTYYYRVRAVNAGGTSASSGTGSQGTSFDVPNAPVLGAITTFDSSSLTLTWSAPAVDSTHNAATGYALDVATTSGFTVGTFVGAYNNLALPSSPLTTTVTGLSSNTQYWCRLRASNTAGASANSNVSSQTTLLNAPNSPTSASASSITGDAFTLNWSAPSTDATHDAASSYTLDVARDSGFTSFVAGYHNYPVSSGATTSLALPAGTLVSGKTYYYRVKANNSGGSSLYSGPQSPQTTGGSPPFSFIRTANAATGITGTDAFDNSAGTAFQNSITLITLNSTSPGEGAQDWLWTAEAVGTNPFHSAMGVISNDASGAALNAGELWVTCYVKFSQLPSATTRFIWLLSGASTVGSMQITSGGRFAVADGTTTVGTSSAVLTTGQWYVVMLHYRSNSGGSGLWEGYLGTGLGSTPTLFSGATAITTTKTLNVTQINVGNQSVSTTIAMELDAITGGPSGQVSPNALATTSATIDSYTYSSLFGTLTKRGDSSMVSTLTAEVSSDSGITYATKPVTILERTAGQIKFAITNLSPSTTYTNVVLNAFNSNGVGGSGPISLSGSWPLFAWPSTAITANSNYAIGSSYWYNTPAGRTVNSENTFANEAKLSVIVGTADDGDGAGNTYTSAIYAQRSSAAVQVYALGMQIDSNAASTLSVNGKTVNNPWGLDLQRNNLLGHGDAGNNPATSEVLLRLANGEYGVGLSETSFLHASGTSIAAGNRMQTGGTFIMNPGDAGWQDFLLRALLIRERDLCSSAVASSSRYLSNFLDNCDARFRLISTPTLEYTDTLGDPTSGPQNHFRAAVEAMIGKITSTGMYFSGNATRLDPTGFPSEYEEFLETFNGNVFYEAWGSASDGTYYSETGWWQELTSTRTVLGADANKVIMLRWSIPDDDLTKTTPQQIAMSPDDYLSMRAMIASVWLTVTNNADLRRLCARSVQDYHGLRMLTSGIGTDEVDLNLGTISTAGRQLGTTHIYRVDGAGGDYIEYNPDSKAHVATGGSGLKLSPHMTLTNHAGVQTLPFRLYETFDDNSLDTGLWSSATTGSATYAEASGQARFSLVAASGTNLTALTSVDSYSFTGATLAFKVVDCTYAGASTDGGVFIGDPANLSGNRVAWHFKDAHTLEARYLNGGSATVLFTVSWVNTTYLWLRIRESSGAILWDSSADRLTWTNRATLSTASLTWSLSSTKVQLYGGTTASEALPGHLYLDSLSLT